MILTPQRLRQGDCHEFMALPQLYSKFKARLHSETLPAAKHNNNYFVFLIPGLESSKISDPSDREQEFLPHPMVESRMSRGSEI